MGAEAIFSDYMLPAAYILGALAAALAILMPLIKAFDNPRSIIGTFIGLGVLAVIFFIGYAVAGNEVTAKYETFGVDAGISQTIGGVLIMFYILLVVAALAIVVSEVSRIFK